MEDSLQARVQGEQWEVQWGSIIGGRGEIDERFLRYVTRRAKNARKKKPGHSGRNDRG
jgi:hypothetical protein